jgi:outer membrane protein assembly factor BamB
MKRDKLKQIFYHSARGVALGAPVFLLVLCILIIANYFQAKAINPLNSPALDRLMEKLHNNPEDHALKEEIRALDMLARKAYFANQWQLRTGGFMLLGGILILLVALKIMSSLHRVLPKPEGSSPPDEWWLSTTRSRKWIALFGTFLLAATLVSGILTHSELSRDDLFAVSSQSPGADDFLKNWPNFRGPGGNGVATTNNAPVSWDVKSGKGIRWKTEVPMQGFSSPVVWGERIFLTGGDEKKRELYCFDTNTGNMVWQKQVTDIPGSSTAEPQIHDDTGYAPSSPATNGKYVFAIYPTGDLIGFDLDGSRIWAQSLGLPVNHYGHASSLMIFENLLIVQYDQDENPRLLALNVATGDTIWRVQRSKISWSSPICVNTGSRMELILTNSKSVDAYDPKTGIKLWGENCLGGEMGPSATFANGMVFAANDYAVAVGIRIGQKQGEPAAKLVWKWDENLPDTASPVATDNYVFLATSRGYIICLDAKTGKMLWEQEFEDGFYSSPILVGDRVYALDLQGVMHIFKADKTYQSIAESKLGEPSSCTPAILEGRMFLRGDKYLYSIGD